MKYKIKVVIIEPKKDESSYEKEVEIYEQSTDKDIDLMSIINAFNGVKKDGV